MDELKQAISNMKRKGAEGPDEIPPKFLKALGPVALTELLDIYNMSFSTAAVPQTWKNAIILPLLKADKPVNELSSFRPISLTSCICKVMKKMLNERLYHLAESRGILSRFQKTEGLRRPDCKIHPGNTRWLSNKEQICPRHNRFFEGI